MYIPVYTVYIYIARYALWICGVCVCVFSQLCLWQQRSGCEHTHSLLSVGGEAHRSIETAHQCPYKQQPNHHAYRTPHISVVASQLDIRRARSHTKHH